MLKIKKKHQNKNTELKRHKLTEPKSLNQITNVIFMFYLLTYFFFIFIMFSINYSEFNYSF